MMTRLKHSRIGKACAKLIGLAALGVFLLAPDSALARRSKRFCSSRIVGYGSDKPAEWKGKTLWIYIPLEDGKTQHLKIPESLIKDHGPMSVDDNRWLVGSNAEKGHGLLEKARKPLQWRRFRCAMLEKSEVTPPPKMEEVKPEPEVKPEKPKPEPQRRAIRLPRGVTGKGTKNSPYKFTIDLKSGNTLLPLALGGYLDPSGNLVYWKGTLDNFSPKKHSVRRVAGVVGEMVYKIARATGARVDKSAMINDMETKLREVDKKDHVWTPKSDSAPQKRRRLIKPGKSRPGASSEAEEDNKTLAELNKDGDDLLKRTKDLAKEAKKLEEVRYSRKNPLKVRNAYKDQIKAIHSIYFKRDRTIRGMINAVLNISASGRVVDVNFEETAGSDLGKKINDHNETEFHKMLASYKRLFKRVLFEPGSISRLKVQLVLR